MYSYTSNNPVNFVDPTGHAWIVDSNSRGEIQTIASAAKLTKKIQYRKPISKSSSKTTAKKSTSIKKVAKAATKAGRTVIDFSNGVGAGVAESVTLGTSNSLDSNWGRENEGVYISGKIVGNGIMAIAGGVGAGASGAGAIVTSPTGVGEVAFSGAAVASAGVSATAVACYSHNVNVLFSMSGDKGTGNSEPTSQSQLQKQVEKGQAPKEVDRVDKPHVPGQKPHVHFKDGTSLNNDGTIHDAHKGVPNPSNKSIEWLLKNGWQIGE